LHTEIDPDDVRQLRVALGPIEGFAKVILVSPIQPSKGIEIYRSLEVAA
jgi:hypothetical protein